MECPYCHKDMQKGRIQTQGGLTLLWLPDGHKSKYLAGSSKAVLMGRCGIWRSPTAESYYCPDCKKVITDVNK